jgi:glycosyltransferase involved in cell wall biosynthesis
MRIIALENQPSTQRGGQEHSLYDTCRGLAKKGHAIHLVYNEDGDLLEPYRKFCSSITKVNRYTLCRDSLLSAANSSLELLGSIRRALRIKADVIYANQYHDTLFGGVLARLKRLPFVCHLRLFPPGLFCGQWRIGMRSVTRFITVSHATRNAYIKAGIDPSTIVTVYNGVDLQRFAPADDMCETRREIGIPQNSFVVIYAGRMDQVKNIEMLIESFALLNPAALGARLLMIGGPLVHASSSAGEIYVEELKSLCEKRGIAGHVHWLGRRSDLPRLFRAADVSVLPSKMPETFGRTLAESMACGVPAVGVTLGGIPEVLQGEFSDFCVPISDVPHMAFLLRSLKDWRHNNPGLAERCRAYVEAHFSAEGMVTGIEAALQHAVRCGTVRSGPPMRTLRAWNSPDTP